MHLAYSYYPTASGPKCELCIVPDKPENWSLPFPVDLMLNNPAAFYFIGPGEGINVHEVPEENAKILEACPPAFFFITPNRADNPGVKATELKIIPQGDKQYSTFYKRDNKAEWKEFVSNQQRKEFS